MKLFNKVLLLTAVISGATACSSDETLLSGSNGDNTPLVFAAKLDVPKTRATYDGSFDNADNVSVMLDGNILNFKASDSKLLPVVNIYWNDYDTIKGIAASAWFPASSSYSYQVDQSNKAKLQSADFLFAETVSGIKRSNYKSLPITFLHRTAKVGVSLKAGLDIKDDDLKVAEVKLYGYTKVTSIDTVSATSKGTITGNTEGWISPYKGSNDEFTALMLPVSLTAVNVIKVSMNGVDYYYKGDIDFKEAKYYNFEITVNKTGLTLESRIEDWKPDGNKNTGGAEME